jgi:uncharacterized protein with HEPN domain
MFYLEETKKEPIYFVTAFNRTRWDSSTNRDIVTTIPYVNVRNPWSGRISSQTILGCSYEDLNKEMKKHLEDKIDSLNANVYFSKNTDYPRFKTKNTTFKKVLKPADADYCIFSKDKTNDWSYKPWRVGRTVYIFKTDTGIFAIARETFDMLHTTSLTGVLTQYMTLKKNNNCYGMDVKIPTRGELLYKGEIVIGNSKTMFLMKELMEGHVTKLIDEVAFDKAVCAQLSTIGMEEIKNIISFIQSPDEDTNELGWRTLVGYDITKIPVTAKLIILLYSNKMKGKTLYSAGMEATLNTLKIAKDAVRNNYYNTYSIGKILKGVTIDPEEMYLVRMVVLPFIKNHFDDGITGLQETLSAINLSVIYDYSFSDIKEESE